MAVEMSDDGAQKSYDLGYFDHLLSERDHRVIGRRPLKPKTYRSVMRERCLDLIAYMSGEIDYKEYCRRKSD